MGEKSKLFRDFCLVVVNGACFFVCCVLSLFAIVLVTALVFQSACPLVCKRFHNSEGVSASWNEFVYKSDGNSTNFGVFPSLFRASGKAVAWYMGQRNGDVLAVHQKVSRTICKNTSNGVGKNSLTGGDPKTPVVKTFLLETTQNSVQEAENREFKTSSDGLFLKGNVQKQPLPRWKHHGQPVDSLNKGDTHEEFQPDIQALPRKTNYDQYDNSPKEKTEYPPGYQLEENFHIQTLPRELHHDQPPNEVTGYTEYQLAKEIHNQAVPRGIHRGQSDNSPSMRKRHKEHLRAKTWSNQESQNVRLINWLTQATVQNLEIENGDDKPLHAEMIRNDVGQYKDDTTDILSVFDQNNPLKSEQYPTKSVRNFEVSGDQQMRTILDERVMALETTHVSQKESLKDASNSASTGNEREFHQHQHHKSRNNPYGTDVADFVSASSGNITEATSSPTSTSPKERDDFLYLCVLLIVVMIWPMFLLLISWLVHRRENRRPVERLPLLAHQNIN